MAPARHEMCMEHSKETVVELLNGNVTSGSRRLLAAEIDKPPLLTNEKTQITCERCTIDTKHVLNTNRKPWSLYRLMTSLPVSNAPLRSKLTFRHNRQSKTESDRTAFHTQTRFQRFVFNEKYVFYWSAAIKNNTGDRKALWSQVGALNETLACKGDTLPALLVWFHHNLAGFPNSNNDFCYFLSVITPIMMALTHC
jgi:hypothetical protein